MEKKNYSLSFKRKALLEYAHGKNIKEIFGNIATSDKKYCAKLLHKWKKIMYKNKQIFYSNTLDNLKSENDLINENDDIDDVLEEFKKRNLN